MALAGPVVGDAGAVAAGIAAVVRGGGDPVRHARGLPLAGAERDDAALLSGCRVVLSGVEAGRRVRAAAVLSDLGSTRAPLLSAHGTSLNTTEPEGGLWRLAPLGRQPTQLEIVEIDGVIGHACCGGW